MGATPFENELMQYWPKLAVVQQESILSRIKSMIQPEAGIDIEQYNREIDEAVARVESGRFYTQEEVERTAKDW
jgi:predicted transcriptional regulator